MSALFRILGAVTIALAVAAPARAETIVLTSGALDWTSGGFATVTLSGGSFSFEGRVSPFEIDPRTNCGFPPYCREGTNLSLSMGFSGGDIGGGSATYNGETYSPVGSLAANASLTARWSGGLLIPSGFTGGDLTAPFGFSGEFYYNPAPHNTGDSVLNLLGSGTARLTFAPSVALPGNFTVTAVRYEIGGLTPAPVPEPTSMLLIGSGLAGLAALRRRLRRSGEDLDT